jgi:hypothetical protein
MSTYLEMEMLPSPTLGNGVAQPQLPFEVRLQQYLKWLAWGLTVVGLGAIFIDSRNAARYFPLILVGWGAWYLYRKQQADKSPTVTRVRITPTHLSIHYPQEQRTRVLPLADFARLEIRNPNRNPSEPYLPMHTDPSTAAPEYPAGSHFELRLVYPDERFELLYLRRPTGDGHFRFHQQIADWRKAGLPVWVME